MSANASKNCLLLSSSSYLYWPLVTLTKTVSELENSWLLTGFLRQDPQGSFVRPKILDNGDGTYVVTYTPSDVGCYTVGVKYGGQNVPSAPFKVITSPTGDASKVKILGKRAGVSHNLFSSLSALHRLSSSFFKLVMLRFQLRQIFACFAKAGKRCRLVRHFWLWKNYFICWCSSVDGIRTTIPVGEECVININTADAGYGNITCHIRSTSGSDVDIDVVDNGDGTVSVLYTPRVPGAYTLNIKFGGQPIPNGNFVQQVGNKPLRTKAAWCLVA
jgi:filamin